MSVTHGFRAKPVPLSTMEPRLEKILSHKRKPSVQKPSIPFSFFSREPKLIKPSQSEPVFQFKAAPIPKTSSVLIYDRKMHEEEITRQKRIRETAELSYSKSHMPTRMQKEIDRKSQLPPKSQQENYPFKPKIG